jgi:Tyrosine-protein kinase ephrin type A/B receptor-like
MLLSVSLSRTFFLLFLWNLMFFVPTLGVLCSTTLPCPIGQICTTNVATGVSSCYSCNPGQYSNTIGATTKCTVCPKGQYQPKSGSSACLSCPSGSTTPGTSCSNVSCCSVIGVNCSTCSAGSYCQLPVNPGAVSKCYYCPAGQSTSSTGSINLSSCSCCSAGQYSGGFGSSCSKCQAGQYTTVSACASSCSACPVGQYTSTVGASSCITCPAGSTALTAGSTICIFSRSKTFPFAGKVQVSFYCTLRVDLCHAYYINILSLYCRIIRATQSLVELRSYRSRYVLDY